MSAIMIGEYALIQADLYLWKQIETLQLHTSAKDRKTLLVFWQ